MRLNICSCLLVFVLGCKVTAAIKHEVVEEKQPVSLPCLHSVEGEVTWSRETNGHRVDILTGDGDADKKHIADPGRRYSSLADKSLYILSVTVSDSGTYLCNNAAAVELTVIPSGTTRLIAPKSTTVTLNCPLDVGVSHVPTWRQDRHEVQQDERVHVSPVTKTLTIGQLMTHDSGLYYCDGKLAAYLTVMEAETSDRGTTRYKATEKTSITLNCPRDVGGSHVPTWSKDGSEVQENIWVYVSHVDKTLTLTYVQPRDSGLYYCDGKPAVYLTVMEAETSDRGTTRLVAPKSTTVTLNCPLDVGGSHVPTWRQDRREVQQDEWVHVSPVSKTLTIRQLMTHDSGLYYCDGKLAVYLTVMEAETSDRGTTRLVAPVLTTVTLNCPLDVGGSDVPTWSKDGREIQQNEWVHVSPVNKTLTIGYVQPGESGLYYCDGKPAVYLTVMEADTSDRGKQTMTRPPTTTTKPTTTMKPTITKKPPTTTNPIRTTTTEPPKKRTKKPTKNRTTTSKPTTTKLTNTTSPSSSTVAPTDHQLTLTLVIGIVVPLLLIILLLIFYLIHRCRLKMRGTEERCHVYDEIQGGAEFQVTNGVERVPVSAVAYCMVEYPATPRPNETVYSQVN
ncbi:hemicentin-1-like [Sparus aurata]|uniref:hemicentin-1-like n=1 Tax=Sparus aurata TaxID=8175 RepID=UPI0011C13FF0|nr:hemicentin-1-like [Sparus aurata]